MQKPIDSLVLATLEEDIGQEDLTTNTTVTPSARCRARLMAKQQGILSGMKAFKRTFELMEADLQDWTAQEDGVAFEAGQELAAFTGTARAVLTAERTALNFLQHLSGVATLTAQYVARVGGLNCKICGTRKTMPMLRQLEKQAIVHGGGYNHRHTLFNGILIKENHITAAGSIAEAIRRASSGTHHLMRIGIEVENLDEFDQALANGADVILLDNMDYDTMREAVQRSTGKKVVIEASGNASLDRVRDMAETGVDFISVGALTHSAPAADLSLLIGNV